MSQAEQTPERRVSDLGSDITLLGDEHVARYRETDGETGYIWNGATILLMTSKGRKSGLDRSIAIIYTEVDGAYVIIASKGGSPVHPGWYHNISADPRVTVQIKGEVFAAMARTAEGDERDRIWQACCAQWPNYNVYQSRTSRVIPVVVLERI